MIEVVQANMVCFDKLSTAVMLPYSILRDLETWKGTEFTNMKSIDNVTCRIFANNSRGILARTVLLTGFGFRRLDFPCNAGTAGPKISWALLISATETGEL